MFKKKQIREFMTRAPHTIVSDISIDVARDKMREYQVRHLPVLKGGKLVGIVSDRNLQVAMTYQKNARLLVEDVLVPDPYVVSPQTTLEEVVEVMAQEKYGSVVIEDPEHRKVLGIFTTVDVCRVLKELLNKQMI